MNNLKNIEKELNELLEEGLIKDFKILKREISAFQFQMTTLEEEKLTIELSVNFCYRIINKKGIEDKLYESMESLLTQHSSVYGDNFSNIISNKLKELNKESDV
jgi:hypothetical protein